MTLHAMQRHASTPSASAHSASRKCVAVRPHIFCVPPRAGATVPRRSLPWAGGVERMFLGGASPLRSSRRKCRWR
eukprot:8141629-Alexandrium_andersonii.AAC.1